MNQDRRWENEYHTKQIEIPEFMQRKQSPEDGGLPTMPGKRPPCLSEAPCLSPDRETEESGRHIKGGIATKRHTRQTFIESGALLRGVPRLFRGI